MNDGFFNFLVATDQLDEFIGSKQTTNNKIPNSIMNEIISLAEDYNNDLITADEVQDVLMRLEKESNINYENLYKIFKENI